MFLRKETPFEQQEAPRLVIIDVTSSVHSGSSFMAEMRSDTHLQSIPVVVVGPEPASRLGQNALAPNVQTYIDTSQSSDGFRHQLKEACLFALWLFAA